MYQQHKKIISKKIKTQETTSKYENSKRNQPIILLHIYIFI